jgi:hypothetical protein
MFTPVCFTPFCFNAPCQFKPLLYFATSHFRFDTLWTVSVYLFKSFYGNKGKGKVHTRTGHEGPGLE